MARQTYESPLDTLSKSTASDSGKSAPIDTTPMPLAVFGGTSPFAPGTIGAPRSPAMRACDGPFRSASRIATRAPSPRNASASCMVSVLLPTPPLPEPTATRWRTSARLSAICDFFATTWPMTSEPPSPAMSWYVFIRSAHVIPEIDRMRKPPPRAGVGAFDRVRDALRRSPGSLVPPREARRPPELAAIII